MTIWTQQQREDWEASRWHIDEPDQQPEPGSLTAAIWAAQDAVNAAHADTLARIEALSIRLVDAFYRDTVWSEDDDREYRQLNEIMRVAHYEAWLQVQREALAQS